MKQEGHLKQQLRDLLSSQNLAVLATHHRGQPHATLVAFAASSDLKYLVFATNRETRKFTNITEDPRVSLLIDNSTNDPDDFMRALAVTVNGSVTQTGEPPEKNLRKLYITKHPHLEDFVNSPTCALITVQVDVYSLVSRFQDVSVLVMKDQF